MVGYSWLGSVRRRPLPRTALLSSLSAVLSAANRSRLRARDTGGIARRAVRTHARTAPTLLLHAVHMRRCAPRPGVCTARLLVGAPRDDGGWNARSLLRAARRAHARTLVGG